LPLLLFLLGLKTALFTADRLKWPISVLEWSKRVDTDGAPTRQRRIMYLGG